MKSFSPSIDTSLIDRLKRNYFFDKEKILHFKKGEYLIQKGEKNDKLFFISNGLVAGYFKDEAGQEYEIFRSGNNMFVGLNSFFSCHHKVYASVKVLEDCTALYITTDDKNSSSKDFTEDFLPLILHELSLRQQLSGRMTKEKEATLKKLYENDKLATLGQMAAGLAHELNNTTGVINGNVNWLAHTFGDYIKKHESKKAVKYFEKGVTEGQRQTSDEVRGRKAEICTNYNISAQLAKKIVRIGISKKELSKVKSSKIQETVELYFHFWQMGVAIHDVLLSSNHSTRILKSIKQLSTDGLERFDVDINESINEALTLIQKSTRGVEVTTKLNDIPIITANNGELVQVWINLIKNACESMHIDNSNNKKLIIETHQAENQVQVQITDNGGGISQENIDKIFRPNFTTKKGGLSFGLGLGLSIVLRIINSYEGTINVESENAETKFTVTLPIE